MGWGDRRCCGDAACYGDRIGSHDPMGPTDPELASTPSRSLSIRTFARGVAPPRNVLLCGRRGPRAPVSLLRQALSAHRGASPRILGRALIFAAPGHPRECGLGGPRCRAEEQGPRIVSEFAAGALSIVIYVALAAAYMKLRPKMYLSPGPVEDQREEPELSFVHIWSNSWLSHFVEALASRFFVSTLFVQSRVGCAARGSRERVRQESFTEFRHGLFSCHQAPLICFVSWCFPAVRAADNAYTMGIFSCFWSAFLLLALIYASIDAPAASAVETALQALHISTGYKTTLAIKARHRVRVGSGGVAIAGRALGLAVGARLALQGLSPS